MHAKEIYAVIDQAKEEERENIALSVIEKHPYYINEVREAINAHRKVTGNPYFLVSRVLERNSELVSILDRLKRNKYIVLKSKNENAEGLVYRKQKNKIIEFSYTDSGLVDKKEHLNLSESRFWDKYSSKEFLIPDSREEKDIMIKAISQTRDATTQQSIEV